MYCKRSKVSCVLNKENTMPTTRTIEAVTLKNAVRKVINGPALPRRRRTFGAFRTLHFDSSGAAGQVIKL
uniref:Uncharacterized protein n=1 Tax=Trichogramma kaykai TaxID=54128 RepID=A0ABD2XFP6_9HYME